jgi:cytochrome c oxidase subunit 2
LARTLLAPTSVHYAIETPSIFNPVSTPAFAIRDLSFFVLAITAAIFVIVAGVAAYTLIRFGRRRAEPEIEPAQVYGSKQIELAWTIVPLLIVVVLFLVTARYIWGLERRAQPPDALEITVVGHQWWWEIRYPKLGIITANEIHVPVSDATGATPTFITLESVDVAHSFWVPQLAGKMDVIPNKTNRVWIEPRRVGTYVGQCAEYCGLQHAVMLLVVVVHPEEEFRAWVASQQTTPLEQETTRPGRELFSSLAEHPRKRSRLAERPGRVQGRRPHARHEARRRSARPARRVPGHAPVMR